jgi:hypothetical protein
MIDICSGYTTVRAHRSDAVIHFRTNPALALQTNHSLVEMRIVTSYSLFGTLDFESLPQTAAPSESNCRAYQF